MLISGWRPVFSGICAYAQPIVYLERKDAGGWMILLRENILNSCYVVHSKDELTRVLNT